MLIEKLILPAMLLLLVSGCGLASQTGDLKTYCTQTDTLWDDHIDALIVDGGNRSLVTGDRLVTVRDEVCREANN